MAYGRLDVYGPEGFFETFSLVENNISVGRSTGNTIALDTNTISRYHFSITHDADQVYVTDLKSVNGTFVDGVKLSANERRALYGGEEIQIGHLRIVYHHIDEMPTQPMAALEETTQRIELQLPAFRIDIQGPPHPVSPGAHLSAELMITNTSQDRQTFIVEVSGPPTEWVRVNRPRPELDPEEVAQVVIHFKPLRRPDSRPGSYPVKVRVRADNKPDMVLEASVMLNILPYGGFGIALANPRIISGERFRLHLHNQGSGNLPLAISGRDLSNRLRFSIPTPRITLAPGQRLTLQGEVKPSNPSLFGNSSEHQFDLVARSQDAAGFLIAVRGRFVEKPMLPAWSPAVLGAGVLLAAIIFIGALVLLLRPVPQPRIAAFLVDSTQVARGTPLALNWSVTDVAELSVSVNGTPQVSQVDPRTSGIELDTSNLSGQVVVSVVGANGSRLDTASQTVLIYQPMALDYFVVEPQQLVRYAVQPISVRWSVPGAVSTRIGGLDAFTTTPVQLTYDSEGEITDLAGIPSEGVTITLFAQDEVGNTLEESITLELVTPQCMPVSGAVTLFAGPDPAFQVVGTVPTGASVVVDAQNDNGQWLRAQLTGGASGWGARTAFVCANNFNVDNLRKAVDIPVLPTPTITPTLTATRIPPTATPVPTATATGSGG